MTDFRDIEIHNFFKNNFHSLEILKKNSHSIIRVFKIILGTSNYSRNYYCWLYRLLEVQLFDDFKMTKMGT